MGSKTHVYMNPLDLKTSIDALHERINKATVVTTGEYVGKFEITLNYQ